MFLTELKNSELIKEQCLFKPARITGCFLCFAQFGTASSSWASKFKVVNKFRVYLVRITLIKTECKEFSFTNASSRLYEPIHRPLEVNLTNVKIMELNRLKSVKIFPCSGRKVTKATSVNSFPRVRL